MEASDSHHVSEVVRRTLVTGGSGYLGRYLVRELQRRSVPVRVLTRRAANVRDLGGVEVVEGDVTDRFSLRSGLIDVDVVFHVAGVKRNGDQMWRANVTGTDNLLREAVEHGVKRFVHVSSVGVIGADPLRGHVLDEEAPCNPRNAYEKSKFRAEELVRGAETPGFEPVIVRPADVFGPGDPRKGLLALARKVRGGWFLYVGGRDVACNYVFAEDVAHACLALAGNASAAGRTYHICDPCTLGELVDALADELSVPRPSLQLPGPVTHLLKNALKTVSRATALSELRLVARLISLNACATFGAARLANEAGFMLPVGWRAGLARLVAWYRGRGEL